MIYWKTDWLKQVEDGSTRLINASSASDSSERSAYIGGVCTEDDVSRATLSPTVGENSARRYSCQATQLPYASKDLSPWDIRQYLEDITSGNVGLARWIRGFIYISYQNLINLGIGLGQPLRLLFDFVNPLWGGPKYPRWPGTIPAGEQTPIATLNLQEGELVRVKSHDEILATCSTEYKNRGLYFDGEMVPYCGGTYRVHKRVTQILDEKTGEMMPMKTPCIILEDVVCKARYSNCRMFCPREIYPYWREIWLERIPERLADSRWEAPAGNRA